MRFKISKKGFTLIDVLVGIALMLIVFLGIFGAYQLGLKIVGLSRNKITATAIANQKIEMIRNLPYEDVGTNETGCHPCGVLEPATSTIFNNIGYTIETRIDYVVDSADGIADPDDECPNDYKRVEIKISWSGLFGGNVSLGSDVAPKNLAQECEEGGGILSVLVFDAYGATTSFPLIEIKDPTTDQVVSSYIPDDGHHYFSLSTSTYKVVVSKSGYSSERTFGVGENYNGKIVTTPEKPHPIILEGQLTEISFSIDRLSSFSVDTLSPWGTGDFSDSFSNESKISEMSDVVISSGEVNLATSSEGYLSSGYLISIEISPSSLIEWDELTFSDSEPAGTDLNYQIYFASSTDWYLIPDSVLAGNSTGLELSPVDLSGLATTTYSTLKIKGNLSSNSTSSTPVLYDWQMSWITSVATPIPNVTFLLQGEKIIGTDAAEQPVYKYSTTSTSNSSGHIDIPNLEWDSYTFSVTGTSLDLVGTDPSPQPIALAPDVLVNVELFLRAENSLLVIVQDLETLEPVFSATVRLYNTGFGYDVTQYTDEAGQTYFIPLQKNNYNLEVEGPGYAATSTTVWVSGETTKTIKLEQIE